MAMAAAAYLAHRWKLGDSTATTLEPASLRLNGGCAEQWARRGWFCNTGRLPGTRCGSSRGAADITSGSDAQQIWALIIIKGNHASPGALNRQMRRVQV